MLLHYMLNVTARETESRVLLVLLTTRTRELARLGHYPRAWFRV